MKSSSPRFCGLRHGARSLALQILLDNRQGVCAKTGSGVFDYRTPDPVFAQTLNAADRRLTTHLVYGVLRRRGTLDALLKPVLTRPLSKIEPWLLEALRLGAYQQLLLTHIPVHAALHETVELAALWGRPKAKGFLNGVLRSLLRLLTDDRTDRPAADAVPLEGGHYRRLARAVLPDPATCPVEYLAVLSLPPLLARRWLDRYSWDECLRLGFWFAGPSPLWLRVNPLQTSRDTFLAALGQQGIAAEAGPHPQAVRLGEPGAIRDLPGYEQGWFTVQDLSAMKVASALQPEKGWHILDLCAAPGGKTTHLAELMDNQGQIVACDANENRLQTVAELARRLRINIIEVRPLQPQGNLPQGPFDAVLVDVPCSNTGVMGRRPEVRWRLRIGDFDRLVGLQTKLLVQACGRVRVGGVVVYSTCSIEPEENRQVVQAVLQGFRDFALEKEEEQVPGQPADGGYWARMRRKE